MGGRQPYFREGLATSENPNDVFLKNYAGRVELMGIDALLDPNQVDKPLRLFE